MAKWNRSGTNAGRPPRPIRPIRPIRLIRLIRCGGRPGPSGQKAQPSTQAILRSQLELSHHNAGACMAVGQAFEPDSLGSQAGKPDLLEDRVV